MTRVIFPSHLGKVWQCQNTRATDLAAPMVVTVWSSVEEFQDLAMRLAAKVLLPGTGWIAFKQLMDLVGLMMDLLGKRFLPRGSLALFDFWGHLVTQASLCNRLGYQFNQLIDVFCSQIFSTIIMCYFEGHCINLGSF